MVLNRHNSIVYFEYDPDVEDWRKRTGGQNGKKSALYTNFLKRDIDIISWHFDYDDGSFLFISEDYRIFLIELQIQNDDQGSVENMEIKLVNGTYPSQFEFNQVKGYGKYRVFSNNNTGATGRGRVIVYLDGMAWTGWEGE